MCPATPLLDQAQVAVEVRVDSIKRLVVSCLWLGKPEEHLRSKMWDPLHIHNHKRKKCRELYNPDKVKEAVPEANLMCAEQTFAWFGRFKKTCNSMSKIHFHFVLHRLIKQRNAYTSHCYKNGKKPLLPSAKIAKTDNVV